MNGYCDWCEAPTVLFRRYPDGREECMKCVDEREEREARNAELAMTRRECLSIQRARNAEVD